jgi:hypothetical protein
MLWCIDFGNLQFGDLLDSRFNNWVLEYFFSALTNQNISFKTSNFFYPLINNMLFSDNHWFLGIFYSLFRFLNFDLYSSYSIILILESILNFASCYYVLTKFNFSQKSSAIGAFIFAFNTIIAIKISHSQLHFKAFIPLTILFIFQYFEKKDFRYISYTLLCITFQLQVSSYLGMFLIIYASIIILVIISDYKLADFKKFLPIKYQLKTSILIIILSIILLLIYALPYYENINIYNEKRPLSIGLFFELNSIFVSQVSFIYSILSEYFNLNLPESNGEKNLFLGFGVWIAIFSSFFFKKYYKSFNFSDKKIILATSITIIFFFLDKYIPTFFFLQLYSPAFGNLRSLNRFFYVIFFGIIYAVVKFLDFLEKNKNTKNIIIYYFLVFLIIFESISIKYHVSNHKSQQNSIKIYQELAKKYGNDHSILLFTFSENFNHIQENINILYAFMWQPQIKVINGYSGRFYLKLNLANNCSEAKNIILENEKEINKIFKNNFKYDRKKLVIFHDNKICEN